MFQYAFITLTLVKKNLVHMCVKESRNMYVCMFLYSYASHHI